MRCWSFVMSVSAAEVPAEKEATVVLIKHESTAKKRYIIFSGSTAALKCAHWERWGIRGKRGKDVNLSKTHLHAGIHLCITDTACLFPLSPLSPWRSKLLPICSAPCHSPTRHSQQHPHIMFLFFFTFTICIIDLVYPYFTVTGQQQDWLCVSLGSFASNSRPRLSLTRTLLS